MNSFLRDCVAKMDGQPDFLYTIRFDNALNGVLEFPAQNGFGKTAIDLQFLYIDEHWFNVYFYIHWIIQGRNCGSSFVKVHLEKNEYINQYDKVSSIRFHTAVKKRLQIHTEIFVKG